MFEDIKVFDLGVPVLGDVVPGVTPTDDHTESDDQNVVEGTPFVRRLASRVGKRVGDRQLYRGSSGIAQCSSRTLRRQPFMHRLP